MAAGITETLWSLDDMIAKIDKMAPAPKKRGPYKKGSVMSDKVKIAIIAALGVIFAVWLYSYMSPHQSCVRSLEGQDVNAELLCTYADKN